MNLAEQRKDAASQLSTLLLCAKSEADPSSRVEEKKTSLALVISWTAYILFIGAISLACYRRPTPDDFDRYVYEAIVRERHQPVAEVYPLVKHENPRAEASTILDSPEHLEKLEPLYKIRPVYLGLIEALSGTGLSIQHAINLISAVSLFGIGILVAAWTEKHWLSGLIMLSPIMAVGRMGTPDALSTSVVLAALWAVTRNRIDLACIIMLFSVWVRTDNAILLLFIVAFNRRDLPLARIVTYCVAAVLSVFLINHSAANYGWTVLFRWSFLAGAHSPADITPHLSIGEYASVFLQSMSSIVGRLAIWVLMGVLAWSGSSRMRLLLSLAALGTAAHFVLYPSPEDRYLVWAYLAVAIAFIEWASLHFPLQRNRQVLGTS